MFNKDFLTKYEKIYSCNLKTIWYACYFHTVFNLGSFTNNLSPDVFTVASILSKMCLENFS